jgi:glycosyltransferase involved in cell wall biosynthesis
MKKIIYIGNFAFPSGNAAGKRVYANGKLFKELDYEVIFIGVDRNIDTYCNLEETEKEYDGFKFYNYPYPKSNVSWINYNKLFKLLVEFIEKIGIENLGMIIYYGSPSLSLFINKLIHYCRRNNIRIISDCVDWLTVKTNNPFFNLIKWADNTYQKAFLNKRVDGVIAISKYLSSYYEKAGVKTVLVPPLSPVKYDFVYGNNPCKIIVYAGLPFRKGEVIRDLSSLKDRIDITIFLLYEAKKNGANFVFNIYGFTKEEYLHSIPSQVKYVEGLANSIKFHGMKANNEVTEEISKADFTILIRDVNRDTTAGFPTKVSESISCGTPVITTKTSDLEDYIIDRGNGFFIDIQNEKEAVISLLNILRLNKEVMLTMKKHCRNQNIFHYKNYELKMSEFFNELK